MFGSEINIISQGVSNWIGNGMYIALYFVSLIYIFVKVKKNKVRNLFGFSSIILLFIIFNPVFTLLVKSVFNESVYWRLFWMLPTGFTMAYVGVDVVSCCDTKKSKAILIFSLILCIIFCGKLVYRPDNFKEVENLYKFDDEKLEVINIILNDKDEYKKVMAPTECVSYFRQVSSKINLMYGRNPHGYVGYDIIKQYEDGNVEYVATACKDAKCNYIILRKTISLDESFADYGYDYFAETATYTIVKTHFLKKDLQ